MRKPPVRLSGSEGEARGRGYELEVKENEQLLDALEALKALGYKNAELNSIKKELGTLEAMTSDQYIRKGLGILAKRKGV